jgi:hypothetical protein
MPKRQPKIKLCSEKGWTSPDRPKAVKNILKKYLRAGNPLVSSRSISLLGEIGGYGATDNCSPRWAQD